MPIIFHFTDPHWYLLTGLMTGFRRVVGHSRPDPAFPVDDPSSLDGYAGIALSPLTSVGNSSPRKRKSADAHALGMVELRCVRWLDQQCVEKLAWMRLYLM